MKEQKATIWKGKIDSAGKTSVTVNASALLLQWRVQRNEICFWYLVVPAIEAVKVWSFTVRGTGHPLTPNECEKYLDTVLLDDGNFVAHIFKVSEVEHL